MTNAGELREVIELQQRGMESDGMGGPPEATGPFETKITAPARIRFLRGTETVMAARLVGTQTALITVRNQPAMAGVDSTWRAKDGRTGALFNIKTVTTDERAAFVDILAEKGGIS